MGSLRGRAEIITAAHNAASGAFGRYPPVTEPFISRYQTHPHNPASPPPPRKTSWQLTQASNVPPNATGLTAQAPAAHPSQRRLPNATRAVSQTPWQLTSSGDALPDTAGAELHADPGPRDPCALGHRVLPCPLATAPHHQQVSVSEFVPDGGPATLPWPQRQRPGGAK